MLCETSLHSVFPEPKVAFTVPLKDQTVSERDSLRLECEVSKPNQTVKFFKNGKEIKINNKRYKLLSKGNSHKLQIVGANLDDSGSYSAKIGDEQTHCQLLVKGTTSQFGCSRLICCF